MQKKTERTMKNAEGLQKEYAEIKRESISSSRYKI